MADFIKALSITDIPSGSKKIVFLKGNPITILHIDGEFFAISDTCTHAQCSLGGEGILDGTTITCGCHGAQFDVTNGTVLSLPATQSLKSYQVKIEGNDILVGF